MLTHVTNLGIPKLDGLRINSVIIGGYRKFWFTQIYYNLIIAMSFDVAVSLSLILINKLK